MADVQKLKNQARRHEQRGEWQRAIGLYRQALQLEEKQELGAADLSLYNRIGDLHLRLGDTTAAVASYERAVDRYAALDLTTSAIALCNKILRIAPGRTEMYRKLGGLHLTAGLRAEARQNFLEYASRAARQGEVDPAWEALEELTSATGEEQILTEFAERLVREELRGEAVEWLRRVRVRRLRRGEDAEELRTRILEIDPEADPGPDELPAGPEPVAEEPEGAGAAATGAQGEDPDPEPETARPAASAFSPPAPDDPGGPVEGVDLGALVRAEVDLPEGGWTPPSEPGPWPGLGESDAEVGRQLAEFRAAVSEIVKDSDAGVHYDLGRAYQSMGLYEAAIAEYQIALGNPTYLTAAYEALGQCLRARAAAGGAVGVSPPADAPGDTAAPAGEGGDTPAPAGEGGDTPRDLAPPAGEGDGAPAAAEGALPPNMAKLFFEARLAQFRARQAAASERVDHQAHYELGLAYREMGLLQEAVRELRVAAGGPRLMATRALDGIEDIATLSALPLTERIELLGFLHEAGRSSRALALLLELWDEAVARGEDATAIADRIRRIDPQADPVLRAAERDEAPPGPPADQAGGVGATGPAGDPDAAGPARDVDAVVAEAALPELTRMLDELAGLEGPPPPTASSAAAPASAAPHPGAPPVGDDPDAAARYAQALLDSGQLEAAVRELHRAREGYESRRQVRRAMEVVDRLLTLTPEDVALYQRKVEYAFMTNDRNVLLRSYHQLADCLRRQGSTAQARSVYQRILDLDPSDAEAVRRMQQIESGELQQEWQERRHPSPASGVSASGYVDLGELVRAELAGEPQPDPFEGALPESEEGELDFDAMLDRFRTKVTESLEEADYESHLELGIAFKQMGMLDEAIREFQQAIRGLSEPLRAYELLAECFIAQGRHAVAAKLLERIVSRPDHPDEELVGVLYQLGVAWQELGEREPALECYERVFAVNIDYRDVAQRMASLAL